MSDEKTPEQIEQERKQLAREAQERRNNERLERLNQIANQSDENKTRDEELSDIEDTQWQDRGEGRPPHEGDEEEEAEPKRVVADAEAADKAAEEARDAGATDVKVVNGETYYQLIVNGAEVWKTLPQIRADAQKVLSADGYLRDAKDAVKNALALNPSEPKRQDDEAKARKARYAGLLSRIAMGEEEAVNELASDLAQPSEVTPDVVRLLDERVDGRLTFRDAVKWFDSEYAEELKDPDLKQRIVRRDKEIATLYPEMDFVERLKEVGNEARAIRISKGGRPATPQSTQSKEQRKASVRPPQAAAVTRQDEEDEEDGETYSSAISQIAKSRGQGRPIVHNKR